MEAGHRPSQSPLFVRQDSSPSERETPPPLPRNIPQLLLPPFRARFAGDGLDFRRPATNMSSNATSVIDLTDADDDNHDNDSIPSAYATPQPEPTTQPPRPQRLPRFSRQIIDLSAEPDEAPSRPASSQHQPQPRHEQVPPAPFPAHFIRVPSSPEVEFVSERPRSPHSRIQDRHPTPHPQNFEPERQVDLTADLDDDVVHVRTQGRAGINTTRPQPGRASLPARRSGHTFTVGRLANLFARRTGAANNDDQAAAGWGFGQIFNLGGDDNAWIDDEDDDGGDAAILHWAPRPIAGAASSRTRGANRGAAAALPMGMDYTTIGFGLAFEPETPPRPPTPKYDPPPDPGAGFTRSPQEEDVLVCPNCEDELGIGKTDEKKQVWIIKSCGHVCAHPPLSSSFVSRSI